MKKKIYSLVGVLSIILLINTGFAQDSTSTSVLYCPESQYLVKDGLWWTVPDMWKSDSQSFAETIKEFVGVQWVGVKLGRVICLYREEAKVAFPVALVTIHPILIDEPTGTNWVTKKNQYKQCTSTNVMDCPFVQQATPDLNNIYQEIEYNPNMQQSILETQE
jgi:hypothetical protein